MKTTITKSRLLTTAILASTLLLASCGGSSEEENKDSEKGSWTLVEKDKAMAELNTKRSEIEALIGSAKTQDMFDCTMKEMEAKYEGFDEANADYDGMRVIGKECMDKIIATGVSIRGKWNEEDLSRARKELSAERGQIDEMIGFEKTNEFIECAIATIQDNYPNFAAADQDLKGMEKIGADCMTSIIQESN